ncbi:MAG: hypothetical protein LBE75_06085 [Burkholderiales bacterium]|jgi:hypothetical protein|nr:hypothetical protein [Burkholderiales bacterium]
MNLIKSNWLLLLLPFFALASFFPYGEPKLAGFLLLAWVIVFVLRLRKPLPDLDD